MNLSGFVKWALGMCRKNGMFTEKNQTCSSGGAKEVYYVR